MDLHLHYSNFIKPKSSRLCLILPKTIGLILLICLCAPILSHAQLCEAEDISTAGSCADGDLLIINNTAGCTDGTSNAFNMLIPGIPEGSVLTDISEIGDIVFTFEKIDDGGDLCDACQQCGGAGHQGGNPYNDEIQILITNTCTGTTVNIIPGGTYGGGAHGGIVTLTLQSAMATTAPPGAGGTPMSGSMMWDATPFIDEVISDPGCGLQLTIQDVVGADPLCVGDVNGNNSIIVMGVCPDPQAPACVDPVPPFWDDSVMDVCICPGELIDLETYLLSNAPTGGTFSTTGLNGLNMGNGINNPDPFPSTSATWQYAGGCDAITFTYTVQDCDGDDVSEDITISFRECTAGSFDIPSSMCQDDSNYTINAQAFEGYGCGSGGGGAYDVVFTVVEAPCGGNPPTSTNCGIFAGNSLSENRTLNDAGELNSDVVIEPTVSAGTYKIQMTITDPDGVCADFVYEQTVIIHQSGNPTWAAIGPLCESSTFPQNLTLMDESDDSNGVDGAGFEDLVADAIYWSGEGVTDGPALTGQFTAPDTDGDGNPGPGTFNVCVTLGDSECEETFCRDIVVHDAEDAPTAQEIDILCNASQSGTVSLNDLFSGASQVNNTNVSITSNPNNTGSIVGTEFVYTGPGCYEITYSFTPTAPCADAADIVARVFISEAPQPSFVMQDQACWSDGDADFVVTPNVTSPTYTGAVASTWAMTGTDISGGTFSTTDGSFTINGTGTMQVTLTETITTTAGNCTATATCSESYTLEIVVEDGTAIDACFTASSISVCAGGGAVTLSPNTDGGVFTGTGVTDNNLGTGGMFTPPTTPGIYQVDYTINTPNGCTNVCSQNITVLEDYDAADVALVADFDLCVAPDHLIEYEALLAATAQQGGTWNVTTSDFNDAGDMASNLGNGLLYQGGCGTVEITYSLNNCDNTTVTSNTLTINITEIPDGSFDIPSSLCQNDGTLTIGSNFIVSSGCAGTNGGTANTQVMWTVTSGPDGNDLIGGAAVTTDLGAESFTLDPLVEDGIYTIQMSMIDNAGNCGTFVVDEQTIVIHKSGDPTWANPGPLCEGATATNVALSLDTVTEDDDAAGDNLGNDFIFWSGTGVTDNGETAIFTAPDTDGDGTPGPGIFNVCVTVGDPQCEETFCQDIVVNDAEVSPTPNEIDILCNASQTGTISLSDLFNVPSDQLTNATLTASGGTIVGSEFVYNAPACYEITYSFSPTAPCVDGADVIARVFVSERPDPSFEMQDQACWSDGDADFVITPDVTSPTYTATVMQVWSMSGDDVTGGTFSTTDGSFTLNATGIMDVTLTETITTTQGSCAGTNTCTATYTQKIIVQDGTTLDACFTTSSNSACVGGGDITLSPNTNGGVFTGTGVTDNGLGTGGTFTPPSTSGTYTITYTLNTPNGCSNVCTETIIVVAEINPPYFVNDFEVCICPDEIIDFTTFLLPNIPQNGTFTLNNAAIAVSDFTAGNNFAIYEGGCRDNYTITYAYTDCNGVEQTDDLIINIRECASASFDIPSSVCQDDDNILIDNQNLQITGCGPNPGPSAPAYTATFDVIAGPDGNDLIGGIQIRTIMGMGLNAPVQIDPSVDDGTYIIRLTVEDPDGVCEDFVFEQTIVIHASGDPTWTNPSTICETDFPITALSLDNNGIEDDDMNPETLEDNFVTWFGEGITDNGITATFNPADTDGDGLPGPGTFNVCVRVGDPECEEIQCHDIVVSNSQAASTVALVADLGLCLMPDDVVSFDDFLAASAETGGTWTVSDNNMTDPEDEITLLPNAFVYQNGCGSLTLNYSAPSCSGADVSDEITITITESPTGTFDIPSSLCQDDGMIVIDNNFIVTNGCVGTTNGNASQQVMFEVTSGPSANDLIGGSPVTMDLTTNGELTGGNGPLTLDAAVEDGIYTIQMTIIDNTNVCGNIVVDEQSIIIHKSGDPSWTIPGALCGPAAVDVLLELDNPLEDDGDNNLEDEDVYWFGEGIVDNGITATFNAPDTDNDGLPGPGTFNICVQVGDPECQEQLCQDITIYSQVDASLNNNNNPIEICADGSGQFNLNQLYNASTTTNGTFSILCNGFEDVDDFAISCGGTVGDITNNILYYDVDALSNMGDIIAFQIEYAVGDPSLEGTACCDDCYDSSIITIRINEPLVIAINPPEFCLPLPADNEQLDMTNYTNITDASGNNIAPQSGAETASNGDASGYYIVNDNGTGTTISVDGIITPGTMSGVVEFIYRHIDAVDSADNPTGFECVYEELVSIEIYQALVFNTSGCICTDTDNDGITDTRVVDILDLAGGLAPYTIYYTGGTLDVDMDGTADDTDGVFEGDNTTTDFGQLLLNEGETNWSITIVDARDCEYQQSGQCAPLTNIPAWIGANTPACYTDGTFDLSLSNTYDFNIADIQIIKVPDAEVGGNNHEAFNIHADFPTSSPFEILDATNEIRILPEQFINQPFQYAGTYRIILTIGPDEATLCETISVVQELTFYPSFDACWDMPLQMCAGAGSIQINIEDYNPTYDNLADDLLDRDLDEMSVWELVAPNGVVVGTGTTGILLQEGAPGFTGEADGDLTIDPAVLFANHGPGLYSLNHEIGIDICKTSCNVTFELVDSPVAIASTPMPIVCQGDDVMLKLDSVFGGTSPYLYTWSLNGVDISPTLASNTPINCAIFTINTNDLPGAPLASGIYTFDVSVEDLTACSAGASVQVAINDAPTIAPTPTNAIYCQSNKTNGQLTPVNGYAYSTSVLSVDCSNSCTNIFAPAGVDIPSPIVSWYANPVGGEALFDLDSDNDGINDSDLDGDGHTFNPVAAGLVDANVPGTYYFYAACTCVPDNKCNSPRVEVKLIVLDCNASNGSCTYLLVLKDTGNDGWDGASLDVSINEEDPENYKVFVDECGNGDVLMVPITSNDGGTIDLTYWNGALEEQHSWCLFDPTGNIALDENGIPAIYGTNTPPPVNETVRVKLDCPENCSNTEDYYIVNEIGFNAFDQYWELRENDGSLIALSALGDYQGLAPGSIVIDTVQLSSCVDYIFTAFDGSGSNWAGGTWQILGTNPNVGTLTEEGLYFIIGGPIGNFVDEENSRFTIPCEAINCPESIIVFVDDQVDCEISNFVHPNPPTPFVCYPNCSHANPAPITTVTYPAVAAHVDADGNPISYDLNEGVTLPAGANEIVFTTVYADGIIIRCTSTVNVISDPNPVMVCNDLIQISLADNDDTFDCFRQVLPDEVLESPTGCPGQYQVIIFDENDNELIPSDVVGPEQAGMTLTYKVVHIGDGSQCWGQLLVEDKLPPVLNCNDYEVYCTNPHIFDEFYTRNMIYYAENLPANIAGTFNSSVNTSIEIDDAQLGEQLNELTMVVTHNHTRQEDLFIYIEAPNGVDTTIQLTMDTIQLDIFENVNLEDYEGEWIIQIVDLNGNVFRGNFGRGTIFSVAFLAEIGFPKPIIVNDCSEVFLVVLDEYIEETNCDQSEWLGAKLIRVWQAVDVFGNSSTCTQVIGLKAPMLDEVIIPDDIELECGTVPSNPADLTPEFSGEATFENEAITSELHNICDVLITYEDDVLPTCGIGYKIIRTWTVLNCCTDVFKNYEQIIKVEDTQGPVVDDFEVSVEANNNNNCSAVIFSLGNSITDDCSDISYITATYTEAGGIYNSDSPALIIADVTNGEAITGLPLGLTEILISAADVCGNVTEGLYEVNVEDLNPPTAICDDELVISLGSDGFAQISAQNVDEGSHDGCSDVTLEIRRIDGCIGTSEWANTANFACCDIDENVVVELRVTDAAGNSSICWQTVNVEDALPPTIVCPADKTITCNDPEVHTPPTDAASTDDNCVAHITTTDEVIDLDQCQAGVILRTFTASDFSDKSPDVSCTQTITVTHVSDFTVQFPADVTLTTCPDGINGGEPVISNDDCELVAISSEDLVLQIVDDACYKIERTWTIVNWCVYDQDNLTNTDLGNPLPLPRTYEDDGDGYFKWVQTIKVLDDEAPIIDCPSDLTFCDLTDACEGEAELILNATDACSDDDALIYSYKIDAFNDGTFDIAETDTNDATGIYPYGTHLIKWIVEDGCGNTSVCTYLFTIEDCKNPTPVCINGLSIPAMNSNGCVEIWASDLLAYATDNCSPSEFVENSVKMRRLGSLISPQANMTFCCDELGTIDVEIWVEDEAGNSDFCATYLILQDGTNNCEGTSNENATIAGNIYNEQGSMVEAVEVFLDHATNDAIISTQNNGAYAFHNLAPNQNYSIIPAKDIEPLNGVSTYDLVLMSQHILGVNELETPYQLIAADVNNDGNITTFDIVQTRQLILYVINDFPNNVSWRFVDANYVFPLPQNPWIEAFPERKDFSNLTQDQFNTDFIGIKVGDVSGDADANSSFAHVEERNNATPLQFKLSQADLKAATTYTIDFRAKDFTEVLGFQFSLNYDSDAMTFTNIEAGALELNETNIGRQFTKEGILTASWNSAQAATLSEQDILFSLSFNVNQNIKISEAIKLNSRYTKAEAYKSNKLANIDLIFTTDSGEQLATDGFSLHQNQPNPFKGITIVGFDLPEASSVELTIYDISGRSLKQYRGDFDKGYNQIAIDGKDLKANGILYYELKTPLQAAKKKMLLLD